MALLLGTTAPDIMLFPYNKEPDTGSLIPSISTGGAATNAVIKQIAATSRHGIISVPNQPTYKRLLVDVTHEQKSSQLEDRCFAMVADIAGINYLNLPPTTINYFLAVFAARLKLALVGAPLVPGFLIFSPLPAAIRLRLAWMFAYNPGLAIRFFRFFLCQRKLRTSPF